MFSNLTDFGYKRDAKGAIGFYLAYLGLLLLLAMIIGALAGLMFQISFKQGVQAGAIIAIIVSIALAVTVLKSKNQLGNFGYIMLILLSGVLAIFIGGIGGLIPVAYLTTVEDLTKS